MLTKRTSIKGRTDRSNGNRNRGEIRQFNREAGEEKIRFTIDNEIEAN